MTLVAFYVFLDLLTIVFMDFHDSWACLPWMFTFYPEDNVEVEAGAEEPEEAQSCKLSGWPEPWQWGVKLNLAFFLLHHTWARMSDGPQKGTTVNQEGLPGQQNHFIRDRVSAFHLPCPTPGHPPSSVLLSWSILLTFQPHYPTNPPLSVENIWNSYLCCPSWH